MLQNNKFKEAEYRENQIGSDFLSCPVDDGTFALNKQPEFLSTGRLFRLRISHNENLASLLFFSMQIYFVQNHSANGPGNRKSARTISHLI